MSQIYPVKAERRDTSMDSPPGTGPEVGIFTQRGYWFPFTGGVNNHLTFDNSDAIRAGDVAAAINYAYEQGRQDMKREFRELTNPESIARSIGPICAERFGW